MKKSRLALGIVTLLSLGYISASWYTGNVIEKNFDHLLQETTQKINDNQHLFSIEISKNHYERSLFSTTSHLTVTLTFIDPNNAKEHHQKIFDDNVSIYHGPFPIAALAKGSFTPKMAWFEYEMEEQTSPILWKLSGNKPFITAHGGLSYGNYLTVKLMNKAISATKSELDALEGKLDISEGDFIVEANPKQTFVSTAKFDKLNYMLNNDNYISLDSFNISIAPTPDGSGVSYKISAEKIQANILEYYISGLEIQNFENNGNYTLNNKDILTANSKTSIDKIKINSTNLPFIKLPAVEIDNLSITQDNYLNSQNSINGLINTNIGSLSMGKQNLGAGVLSLNYEGIEKTFMGYPIFSSSEKEESATNSPVDFKFSLDNFNWHNDEGDIQAKAYIELLDNKKLTLNTDFNQLKTFKLKFDVPFKVLARLLTQFQYYSDENISPEEFKKTYRNLTLMEIIFLRKNPFLVFSNNDNDKGFYTDIDYDQNREEVLINGKEISKHDFFNNLNKRLP